MELVIVADAGCKPNPGPGHASAVLCAIDRTVEDRTSPKCFEELGRKRIELKRTTSNDSEARAIILGLEEWGDNRDVTSIYSDSELIVGQVLGRTRIRNGNLRRLVGKIRTLLSTYDIGIDWIPRAMNIAHEDDSTIFSQEGVKRAETAPGVRPTRFERFRGKR